MNYLYFSQQIDLIKVWIKALVVLEMSEDKQGSYLNIIERSVTNKEVITLY